MKGGNVGDPNPDRLMTQAVAGDEDALAQLLHQHGPAIRAQLAREIGPKWQSVLDPDDVMQVTYLEAFLRIDRFKPRGENSFQGWLAQIARNNLRDAVEQLTRQKRTPPGERIVAAGDDSAVALMDRLGCTTSTPSHHAGRREVAQAVKSAVAMLPDDYAVVVRLYDLEGRPAAEVASTLGRSEGAVYMLRARAHDRLREAFGSASRF